MKWLVSHIASSTYARIVNLLFLHIRWGLWPHCLFDIARACLYHSRPAGVIYITCRPFHSATWWTCARAILRVDWVIRVDATDNAGCNPSHFYAVRRQQRSHSDVDKDAVTLLLCDVTSIITFRLGGNQSVVSLGSTANDDVIGLLLRCGRTFQKTRVA